MDAPWRRVAATPRPRRGYSAEGRPRKARRRRRRARPLGLSARHPAAGPRPTSTTAPRSARSAGHYNLGSALHARRDLEPAAAHFSRTIALEPTYADAHFNLGIVHQELGSLREALTCYDEAARLDEKLADAAAAADFIRRTLDTDGSAGPAEA